MRSPSSRTKVLRPRTRRGPGQIKNPNGSTSFGSTSPSCGTATRDPTLTRCRPKFLSGGSKRPASRASAYWLSPRKDLSMTSEGHDHDHDRTAAPMVDEITDFEVLEIALRELCIEKGIFTAEDHRRMTEFAEQIGPTPAARLVARRVARTRVQRTGPVRSACCQQGSRGRLAASHGFWDTERLHGLPCAGRYANSASRHRLHVVLLLPASNSGQFP